MRVRYDWSAVQRFYDEGHGRDECMAQFGFAMMSWYKAIRLGKLRACLERQKTIDWAAVQQFYDEGHTFRECKFRFRFAAASWTKAVRRGVLQPRSSRWPLEKVLTEAKSRNTVKRHLIDAGILKNVCEECGLSGSGSAGRSSWSSIIAMGSGMTIGSKTYGCSARIATARRRPTGRKTRNV